MYYNSVYADVSAIIHLDPDPHRRRHLDDVPVLALDPLAHSCGAATLIDADADGGGDDAIESDSVVDVDVVVDLEYRSVEVVDNCTKKLRKVLYQS